MVERREKVSRSRRKGKISWVLPSAPEPEPTGDFLPPGFATEKKPRPGNGELFTYFLYTEKRGLSRYLPAVEKHFKKGFRAALLSKGKLVFDQANARVVGRLSGDHFEMAEKWAKRNVLDELQDEHVRSGGGTERERERTVVRFFRSVKSKEELQKKLEAADREYEQASIEMVLRFGRQEFVLKEEGITLDACYGPGGKVYWRSRGRTKIEVPA